MAPGETLRADPSELTVKEWWSGLMSHWRARCSFVGVVDALAHATLEAQRGSNGSHRANARLPAFAQPSGEIRC
jgi:hypothetical protein